ncbi:MAG TPA: BTAD domain-containing putative transcriptional regulator [Gaiellaceae bacterium]|nr:BTAD domain-containing putative transcriptional regulator [Gaiellaceae bacterium]
MRGAADPRERPAIRLFGGLEIEDGDRRLGPRDLGGVRPKQVLEILLAARGHLVPTDRIAELLWGEQRPNDVAASIQTFVSILRRHLVEDRERARQLVVTEPGAYRFATDLVDLDLDRFDALVERSSRQPTRLARASLEQALSLVRGEVLEDEPYSTWALDLRGSYQGRVLGARLEAADAALAGLDLSDALAHSDAAAALDRFSERAHRTAMLALYALGRQHEALARYRRYHSLLDEELGLEPTAETRALESAILRQEDVRALLPRPVARSEVRVAEPSIRLLGRTRELELLEQAARHALEGSFALLQIEGDAGLGKTRMLDEVTGFFAGARVGRARCSPLEQHLPYVPLAETLRDAGLELDGERLPALGRILPELVLAGPTREYAEVEALEALVEVLSEQAPVVLVFDDLHAADQATVAALGYVQRRCTGVPGALVTSVRTVYAPPGHPIRRLRPTATVRLCPLSAEELAPLSMPGLHEATGGNPRFVTDAVANGKRLELSSSLSETLLAQLRAEGRRVYRTLLTASLLAQPFEPEPLADLLSVDATGLTEELERLCERRILRVDGLRFRFRYELVRRALLGSISPARRRLLLQQLDDDDADRTYHAIGRALDSRAG